MLPTAISTAEADKITGVDITRELDKVKSKVFLGTNAAFLGAVMTTMDFKWSNDIPTAATNGITFWWNPEFFMGLQPDTRRTVFVHELWHAALLHMPRMKNRDPMIWNIACDIRINNDLESDNYSFLGVEDCCKDQTYGKESEEDIYDKLIKKMNPPKIGKSVWGSGPGIPDGNGKSAPGQGDMIDLNSTDTMTAVNNVVRAIHTANLSGQPGSVPGGLAEIVKEFLTPIVPWEVLLQKWTQDLLEEDFTWARPNRRYQDVYLPSRVEDEGRLEHLIFYQDTSGSMSQGELKRTNSEIKYIWDVMQPKKLTTVQFDTEIHRIDEFNEGDRYESIQVEGRGGTKLEKVHQHIIESEPTAAVIFTDLYVEPMRPLPIPIPILWVTKSTGMTVPFGDLIIMKE